MDKMQYEPGDLLQKAIEILVLGVTCSVVSYSQNSVSLYHVR